VINSICDLALAELEGALKLNKVGISRPYDNQDNFKNLYKNLL
jgi:hypothetical protein